MSAEGRPVRCAVLGSPISHSLSPALHTAAYRHLGLAGWTYDRFEVDEPGLAAFLDGLDETWRGLSLTMPLKEVALECVDEVSALAQDTRAINTILIEPDGRRRGDNTDVVGIVAALRERGVEQVAHAVVLGGGATARSALVALRELTGAVTVCLRTPDREPALRATAEALRAGLTVALWTDRRDALHAPLVVSTAPVGAVDDLVDAVPDRPGALLDVVYAPWPTALAVAWSRAGGPVAGGRDMLVHQARRQVELMTGHAVSVAILRAAARPLRSSRLPHRRAGD